MSISSTTSAADINLAAAATPPAGGSCGLEARANTTPAGGCIEFTVYGIPKPKGSLKHIGHGRMKEQLEGSPVWREAVKQAAINARIVGRIGASAVFRPTMEGPIAAEISVTVPKPKSAPKRRRTWPITRSSGDIDKIARNCLDALTDAGLIGDDSQVVDLHIAKCYPNEQHDALPTPGAIIRVWTIGGEA